MLASIALSVLLSVIKNPSRRVALKRELLSLRDAINAAFPGE